MNKENAQFLERNGIDIREITNSIDCHIYNREQINKIVAENGFEKPSVDGKVCISDIVGYDTEFRNVPANIFFSMDSYFDNNGDGYHSRSVGMLEYTKENIMENLQKTFEIEPINVIETGEGTYTIHTNGLHRYTLLRILYLSEITEAKGDDIEIKKINDKYTIPVKITPIDLDKTYCKYILSLLKEYSCPDINNSIKSISTYYANGRNYTEKVEVVFNNGEKQIIDTEEMIRLTQRSLAECKNIDYIESLVEYECSKFPSFKRFIDKNCSSILDLKECKEEEGGYTKDD